MCHGPDVGALDGLPGVASWYDSTMRRALLIGLCASAFLAACLLPELQDLGGAATSDAGPADGAAGDAALGDGASDGSKADASAKDAAACPDGSFCDDFDDGPLGARWSTIDTFDGVLALSDASVSAPNGLRMELAAPAGAERRAALVKNFAVSAAPTRVVCSVSLRLTTRIGGTGDDLELFEIDQQGATYDTVFIKVSATQTFLREEHTGGDGGFASQTKALATNAGGIPDGTWTRVVLDVNGATKSATLSITPEGGSTTPLVMSSLTLAKSVTKLTLILGEPADHDVSPSTTHFDDYRCDVTP